MKFEFKTFSFTCLVVSNYTGVTLQLYIVKNGGFKREKIIVSEKYKAITEMVSGTKPSKVSPKNMVFLEIK